MIGTAAPGGSGPGPPGYGIGAGGGVVTVPGAPTSGVDVPGAPGLPGANTDGALVREPNGLDGADGMFWGGAAVEFGIGTTGGNSSSGPPRVGTIADEFAGGGT
jgi:hypothetical protein